MNKIIMTTAVLAAFGLTSCNKTQQNPLLSEFNTPYGIAPFEQITIDNYREAKVGSSSESMIA